MSSNARDNEKKKGKKMKVPETIKEAWEKREGPVVLATVDGEGGPNVIYASCVGLYGDEAVVVADNYFDKTKKNIQAGSKGAILFMTSDKKAYQVKGTFKYHASGPVFEDMKKWNPPRLPGHGAVALEIAEAYSGAQRLAP